MGPPATAGDRMEGSVGPSVRDEIDRQVRGETVTRGFRDQVRHRPDAVALRRRTGDGGWDEWTWAEYADRACRVAAALIAHGVRPGDRVVLMMRNRPEFHVADVGVLLVGAVPISIYNSSSPEQVEYLAGHCGAVLGIVEDAGYLARFRDVRARLPRLGDLAVIDSPAVGQLGWEDLLAHEPVDLDVAAEIAAPGDLATVIYTSGTTGPPKGVMLDHSTVRWTVESLRRCLAETTTEGRRVVSYLPMAHIAERMTSHYQSIVLGYEITTCPEANQVSQYLPEVRPEVFFAVPRVWEKMQAAVVAMAAADPERKAQLDDALAVGLRVADCRARDEEPPPDLHARWEVAEAGGLALVRTLLGLDQCITAVSGAAPLGAEPLDFFRALGIPISEIYGMSESAGPITWEPFRVRTGMVGRPVPGCEVQLAPDGEVIFRGGNVFRGYLDDPQKTAETLDADGWVHTGDIGTFDADGYLRIIDRKKELIITAGGKNISPANLEAALKAQHLVGQACVIGDARPFVSALVVLDAELAPLWAKEQGIEATSLAELADHEAVRVEVEREVADAMAGFNHAEQVKRVKILHDEWVADSEELTPTMKLKRRGIHAKYAREIEELYAR